MALQFQSATEIATAIRAGERSPVDAVEAYLDRIAERDDALNAYVTVIEEDARRRAHEAEQAIEEGANLGPLHGVPIAIKDLHHQKAGVPHTMGIAPLSDNVAEETAVIVERLEAAGAIVLGTTNTPELGHTMRTDNELVGPTATPFDHEYNAGGSSGGSAAALSDGLCALATGSDVGGSLRIPAACCGVVSIKPSFGLVPKDNRPNAFSSHTPVGVVGPMARTVADAALMLSVMAGPDDADPYSVPDRGVDYVAATDRTAGECDVAYSPDLGVFPVEQSVRDVCREAVEAFADAGASVADVDLDAPARSDLTYAFGTEATPLFAAMAAQLDEAFDLDLTGEDADRVQSSFVSTIRMGQGHDVATYLRSNEIRTALYDAVEAVLDEYDALLCPVTATPPLSHDEPYPTEIDGQKTSGLPMDWGIAWPFNMTGHPAVTVPAGLTDDGLPIGLQVVGSRYDEAGIVGIAAAFEDARPWQDRYPGS